MARGKRIATSDIVGATPGGAGDGVLLHARRTTNVQRFGGRLANSACTSRRRALAIFRAASDALIPNVYVTAPPHLIQKISDAAMSTVRVETAVCVSAFMRGLL